MGDPYEITGGPDGNVWLTELFADVIGYITLSGIVTGYPLAVEIVPTCRRNSGAPCAGPNGISTGPDHKLWFTESAASNDCYLVILRGDGSAQEKEKSRGSAMLSGSDEVRTLSSFTSTHRPQS
jgi:streptogramin lyase